MNDQTRQTVNQPRQPDNSFTRTMQEHDQLKTNLGRALDEIDRLKAEKEETRRWGLNWQKAYERDVPALQTKIAEERREAEDRRINLQGERDSAVVKVAELAQTVASFDAMLAALSGLTNQAKVITLSVPKILQQSQANPAIDGAAKTAFDQIAFESNPTGQNEDMRPAPEPDLSLGGGRDHPRLPPQTQ